uniref:Uncharacterized protein n=1 Tax=Sinocyclocheilus grahami TaxID=75366 RepID=A0A672LK82_SINGR
MYFEQSDCKLSYSLLRWQVAGCRKGAARRGKQASNPKLDSYLGHVQAQTGENFWMEWKLFISLVCLGHFASCESARYQLSMLSCDDPVFSESACDALKELGFTVLTENEVHTSTDLTSYCWCPIVNLDSHRFTFFLHKDSQALTKFCFRWQVCDGTSLPCSPRFLDVFSDSAHSVPSGL